MLGVYELLRRFLCSWVPLKVWEEVKRLLRRMGCERLNTTSHTMQRYPLTRRVVWYRCGNAVFKVALLEPRGRNRPEAVYVDAVEVRFNHGRTRSGGEVGEEPDSIRQDRREAGGES